MRFVLNVIGTLAIILVFGIFAYYFVKLPVGIILYKKAKAATLHVYLTTLNKRAPFHAEALIYLLFLLKVQ